MALFVAVLAGACLGALFTGHWYRWSHRAPSSEPSIPNQTPTRTVGNVRRGRLRLVWRTWSPLGNRW